MHKVDFLIIAMGIACYLSILIDLRNYEIRLEQFEIIQEKRRKYYEAMSERRKMEIAREQALEKRKNAKKGVQNMSGVIAQLAQMQDEEVMKKSKVTSGKVM